MSVRHFILLIIMFSLAGCFGLGSKEEVEKPVVESPHYYIIDIDRGLMATEFAKGRVLRLLPVRVTSQFRGEEIVFRVGEDEYQAQENELFFSTPEEMFTDQFRRWLEKTGLFTQIVMDDSVAADYVMEAAVTALYGDKRERQLPQSVLEMQFFLMDGKSSTPRALFQTGLRAEVEITETTAAETVKGWRFALEELFSTVEADLNGYFAERNTP